MAAYRKVGSPACNEDVMDNMEAFIDRLTIDPMKLICSDFDESDRCDKWWPKLDRTQTKHGFRNPFQPTFELLMTL